jgi:hypothetical protein
MASIAQKYLTPFAFLSSPEYQALSESDKPRAIEMFKSADPAGERLVDWAIEQNTPEARQKIIEQQLALDKARGEQQMKYRMTNDIISNMGKAAYAAFGGGGVPYEYLGQSMANAGNAYLAGRMSGNPAAPVVGQRYF